MTALDGESFTVVLWGTVRGKTVASLAHAYALTAMKLALPPATENAPWRAIVPNQPQDYFRWRKMVVEENRMLLKTLTGLFDGAPLEVVTPAWPRAGDMTLYNPEVATRLSQEYARHVVKILGLSREQ